MSSNNPILLIVEDEPAIRSLLGLALADLSCRIQQSANLAEAREQLAHAPPDLILLDWMLPDGNGIELLRELRQHPAHSGTAVLMLTARSAESDIIRGLEQGADDYLTKPFSLGELKARVKALLRRLPAPPDADHILHFPPIRLDTAAQQAYCHDHPVKLHRREYQLLRLLLEQPNQVHSRDSLLDRIWGTYSDVNDRTVDVAIRRLRQAFAEHGHALPLTTIRGSGYRLDTQKQTKNDTK